MSRAHLPTFPRVMRPDSELPWLSNFRTDLTLLGMTAPPSSISATVSIYSFSQRRVSRTSWCRKGSMLTWNWRHVRDSACKVFRSTARAISFTTLKTRISDDSDGRTKSWGGFSRPHNLRVAAQGRREGIPVGIRPGLNCVCRSRARGSILAIALVVRRCR